MSISSPALAAAIAAHGVGYVCPAPTVSVAAEAGRATRTTASAPNGVATSWRARSPILIPSWEQPSPRRRNPSVTLRARRLRRAGGGSCEQHRALACVAREGRGALELRAGL